MNLEFNISLAESYKSHSQISRVLTEAWIEENMFCPNCGNLFVKHFENNKPVADFFCPQCLNQYELKSKSGSLGKKITDGAYATMINRITSDTNPDLFLMSYSRLENKVENLFLVPKHFFVPDIIEKRKPLADTAKRAGWVGCNILLEKIPKQGKIPIIKAGKLEDKKVVLYKTQVSRGLQTNNLNMRGWLMDILLCINQIPDDIFKLSDMYYFEDMLSVKHPDNRNIKPKIRQQLQFLRDKGFIEFLGNGKYRKLL